MDAVNKIRPLEALLNAVPLTIDVVIDDEWSGEFPVKAVEIEATVLYLELPGLFRFSARHRPAEVLIYQNTFLAWLGGLIRGGQSRVYFRLSEQSVVFLFIHASGLDASFTDALRFAGHIGEHDIFGFVPGIGMASGAVTVGSMNMGEYHRASVFGHTLMVAAGCASMRPDTGAAACISFPLSEWNGRSLDDLFPLQDSTGNGGPQQKKPRTWEVGTPRQVDFPGIGTLGILDLGSFIHWAPGYSAERKAEEWFEELRRKGLYRKSAR
ncbi:hypothetical protein [Prosthecochloris sp. HL-130-GSB]|uniref:Adenylate cyclase n=1 Tax=Prosthecochloris aestuarii TaxID=1102 RepID=A0A831SRK4_PROAE|nr:hypothetical protein [Prosthecochloris sp. HL-130-GSB]ARM30768.1 hypothetical protein B9H02_04925 [Prosthecochloris sp. HL-130-GSB]MBO8093141.1 adenylate cyclase [Prosthecochloris sp.]HED30499.1 adenylate cyclase [Prosthecochloris aestuarii]